MYLLLLSFTNVYIHGYISLTFETSDNSFLEHKQPVFPFKFSTAARPTETKFDSRRKYFCLFF